MSTILPSSLKLLDAPKGCEFEINGAELECKRILDSTLPGDKPIIKPRPSTRIPAKDCTPDRIKEFYREQAEWYQWAINYSMLEADKIRRELPNLGRLMELKELELADLEADIRSFQDMADTYRELAGDEEPDPESQQSDCFD